MTNTNPDATELRTFTFTKGDEERVLTLVFPANGKIRAEAYRMVAGRSWSWGGTRSQAREWMAAWRADGFTQAPTYTRAWLDMKAGRTLRRSVERIEGGRVVVLEEKVLGWVDTGSPLGMVWTELAA